MSTKMILILVFVVLCVIVAAMVLTGCVGKNDDQNWQVVQSLGGDVTIRDESGYYWKGFASVWTWPRAYIAAYNSVPYEGQRRDESIRVTFNDGGTAQISTMIRFSLPAGTDMRRKLHRDFSGQMQNVTMAVKAHLINCCKATAPLMSASEHQSARKAEYAQTVENMLRQGLFKMRKVEKELRDRTDTKGNPILVYATEVISDQHGMPIIAQASPMLEYGIEILQFSVTDTDYDPETRKQFAAKKESFLAAEKSKAQREQEVQERLMVVERGLRQRAEVEAEANKEKAKAIIEAEKKVELAEKTKQQAETKASMNLEVARIEKEEAETRANMQYEVSKIDAQSAIKQAEAIIALAEAEQRKIELAGAITEQQRVLAQIEAERDIEVARHLAQIKTPGIVFVGGSAGTTAGAESLKDTLMNMYLLKQMGAVDPIPIVVGNEPQSPADKP